MGADKTGAPAPLVERGELDQEQHDAVRDVFYIPGAATLVRGDLFSALAGFDPEIELLGEDLDLSWRAHVVGARVLVAPGARVAHLEALSQRRPLDDRRRLQMRHRLRSSRVAYTWWSRVRVIPQAALVALAEFVFGVVTGRFHHAADVVAAWAWNVRHRRSVRARRRLLAEHRTVADRDVRRLQVRGSARVSAFLRGQLGLDESRLGDNRLGNMTGAGPRPGHQPALGPGPLRAGGLGGGAGPAGLRQPRAAHQRHPRDRPVRGLSQPSLGPGPAVAERIPGHRAWARPRPPPRCWACSAAWATCSAVPWACCAPCWWSAPCRSGVLGMWRLARPLGSRRARITAMVVYACLPVGHQRHGPRSLGRPGALRPVALDGQPAGEGVAAGALRSGRRRRRPGRGRPTGLAADPAARAW